MLQARGYERVWDMSACEQDRQYFEGTGVLVLDRVNGVAYVNISERAHPDLAQRWADELGYKVDFTNPVNASIRKSASLLSRPVPFSSLLLIKVVSFCSRGGREPRLQHDACMLGELCGWCCSGAKTVTGGCRSCMGSLKHPRCLSLYVTV